MQQHWIFPNSSDNPTELANGLGIAPELAGLLVCRGIRTCAEAELFLRPKLNSLGDPFLLPNMRAATERILEAIDRKQKVVLYGDYDVDGVTSLTLFARMLRGYGVSPELFLPQRMEEGYGLSPEGVERCIRVLRPQLLIAVDCGTSSAEEIAKIQQQGIDVLVFDHHEPSSTLPDCPVVNPKLGEDYHYLCSAGIVFKACHALLKLRPLPGFDLKEFLDIVALGTVADIVPLIGENRLLVQKGLRQMEKTRWIGLKTLMELASVNAPIRPSHVGFQIGPRLNAAGRLGTAEDALHLLLAEDEGTARKLATGLDRQNRDRQLVQAQTVAEAEAMIALEFDPARDAAIVLGKEGWHPGVLGIVAGKVTKTHHRPTFIIGFDEDGMGKGSGRSIDGFSLVGALGQCGHGILERFGGHEMAAGVTLRRERFDEFKQAFLAISRAQLDQAALKPRLHLDAELEFSILDMDFLGQHDLLQPFGIGNHQPMFFARRVRPVAEPRLLKEKHLSFTLHQNGSRCRAIFFDGARHPLPEPPWDIAFRVERNEYLGNVNLQMQIHAIRSAEEPR